MKKICIGIIIFILFIVIVRKSNNNIIKYKIKYNNETYNILEKKNKDYSYYEISWNKYIYPINIFEKGIKKKSIDKIYSYKDDTYSCILPSFNGVLLTDIMCYKNSIMYNYQQIKGKDDSLDKYVDSIDIYENFNNDELVENKYNNIITFYDSINKNVSVSTYKGILLNNKEIKLFDMDVYSNKISSYINDYYITADYNFNYEFDKFYIVNLIDGEISTLKVKNPISFDTYIQGIVDNKLYLFDSENEIQYEIDPKGKKIEIVSNEYIKYYSNKKWSKISVKQAKKELVFDYNSLDNIYNKYDKVYENDNYYYVISNHELYRIYKNNDQTKEYLMEIPVDEITINDDYLYYVNDDGLYYYSDITGLKLVLTNKEFEFNKDIKYYIY